MPKYLLEDMVKVKRAKEEPRKLPREIKKELIVDNSESVIVQNSIKTKSRYMLWSVAFISVVFCLFSISFLFEKAEVLINPKIKDLVLNKNLSAVKDSSADGLSFDLVVLSGEENTTIKAVEEKDLKEKATGDILIYNTFSTSPQSLAIDTRLEGSNGKIYKTQTKIIIPGMSKSGIPGRVAVGVYAENPGQEYNSEPLDFKILGFRGTPKYAKFYGRSQGEISGGFVGKAPFVSDAEKSDAFSDLRTALEEKLSKKIIDQTPEGFILFKNAIFLSVEEESTGEISNTTDVPIKIKGTLYGMLFNEQNLTKKIIEENNINVSDDVYIPNIRDLNFKFNNQENISFVDLQSINFNLSGSIKIVYKIDTAKLMDDLLGKPKKDFNQILSQYVNIDSASLTLNPPWKRSIPEKIIKIQIIPNYPK